MNTPNKSLTTIVEVKIDGNTISTDAVMGVVVKGRINEFTETRVRILGKFDQWLPELVIGKDLSVRVYPLEGVEDVGFSATYGGEIFELRPVFVMGSDDHEIAFDFVAYPHFRRSVHGRRAATFTEKNAMDVIQDVIRQGEYKNSTLDSCSFSTVHEHLFQFLETDYEFVMRILQRNGANFIARYEDKKICVFKPGKAPAGSKTHTLKLGTNVESQAMKSLPNDAPLGLRPSFAERSPRVSYARGLDLVDIRDFDDKKGTDVAETAKGLIISLNTGYAEYRTESDIVYPGFDPSKSQKEFGDGLIATRNRDLIKGVLETEETWIQLGDEVELEHFGTTAAGKYLVTGQWLTIEEGNVRNHLTIAAHATVGPGTNYLNPPYRGLLTGIVTSEPGTDPDKLGRLRVKFPIDNSLETAWCRIARPFAGEDRGFRFDPEVGDEVLVGFMHDDPDRPVIMGSFYNGKIKPAYEPDKYGNDFVGYIKMHSGNELSFHEKKGQERIYTNAKLDMDTEVAGNKKTDVKKDYSLDVGQNIAIKAGQSITIEAKQSIELKVGGSKVTIDSKGVTIEGVSVTAKGSVTAELSSGGQTKVSGTALTEMSGGIVKIN